MCKANASFAADEGVDFLYERPGFLTPTVGTGERHLVRQAWASVEETVCQPGRRRVEGDALCASRCPSAQRRAEASGRHLRLSV